MSDKVRITTCEVFRQIKPYSDIYKEFLNTFDLGYLENQLEYRPVRPPDFDYYIHNAIHVKLIGGKQSVIFISDEKEADK